MLLVDAEVDRRDFTVHAALRVADGERVALFGPSGAGKTTVLETIAGLVAPRAGVVEVAGRVLTSTAPPHAQVPPWQRRVGLLRQDPALFPHLSARANLLYGRARSAPPTDAEFARLVGLLGIENLLDAMPTRLSGGQRHRVALGRMLLTQCDALLFDEPFSSLDAELRRTLTALVTQLAAERSVPSVLVTHQLADAQAFADRVVVMDGGRVLQDAPPEALVRHPASRRVAELVGYLGFVAVPRDARGLGIGADRKGEATDARPQASVIAAVHPDRVVAGAAPERGLVLAATLSAMRPHGAGWEIDARVGDAPLTFRLPDRPVGQRLEITVVDPPLLGPDGAAATDAAPGSQ